MKNRLLKSYLEYAGFWWIDESMGGVRRFSYLSGLCDRFLKEKREKEKAKSIYTPQGTFSRFAPSLPPKDCITKIEKSACNNLVKLSRKEKLNKLNHFAHISKTKKDAKNLTRYIKKET